jgi:hypothetical protein
MLVSVLLCKVIIEALLGGLTQQDKADAVNEIRLLASIRHHHVVCGGPVRK